MAEFKIVSDLIPKGDQPEAIAELVRGLNLGEKHQTLLGDRVRFQQNLKTGMYLHWHRKGGWV